MRWGLLALVAGCIDSPPFEPPPAESVCDAIRANLEGALVGAETPGAIVAFEQPGEPLCVVAAGFSDPENGIAAESDQLYHVGSSTKTFISAAILLLAKDGAFVGKEGLDAWFPGIVARSNEIGVAHLLTNTSGIPNYTEVLGEALKNDPSRYDMTQPTTPENLVAISQTVAHRFTPGSRFEYSNTGWILLGMIVEKASGKPWRDFVREQFWLPLGMQSTFADRLTTNRPLMRSWATNPATNTDIDATDLVHPSWAGAAGSVVSTVSDMATWTSALYSGSVVDGDAYTELVTPQVVISADTGVAYSLGTIIKPTRFGDWTGHGGDWGGSRTYLGGLRTEGMFLNVATNREDSNRFAVADVAWRAALGEGLGTLAPFVSR